MEWKIGEIRQVNGKWYQCVIASGGCFGCSFRGATACTSKFECFACKRNDHKSVIFRKLEKVEKPFLIRYSDNSIIKYQRYKIYAPFIIEDTSIRYFKVGNLLQLDIEIKQNKEDMEQEIEYFGDENNNAKHSNSEKIGKDLRPFDLKAAKAGNPVCTREGRKVRIICFDAKGDQPIIALVTMEDGKEFIETYHPNGRFNDDDKTESDGDLMMLPEKKEGWVNVYKVGARLETGGSVHSTKDDAIKCINSGKKHIATVKIEWEE